MLRRARRAQSRPTLSVVCGTHHPGAVVASALRPFRGIADEVLVGADDRVSEGDLAWYGSVADRVMTYPFLGPNQHRGWLRDQASSEWLLLLDGDELPSQSLLDALPDLMSDRYIAAYLLRRWWVAPDGQRVLDEPPWSPDYQCRLVRNDDRLWFPSVKHSGASSRGPTRRIEESIVHLDLALESREDRERKVAKYETEQFGHLTAGRSTNESVYLPEQHPEVRVRDLPPPDAVRVQEALSPSDGPHPRRHATIERSATATDILRTLPWSLFSDDDARARIDVLEHPAKVPADIFFDVDVRVQNLGGRTWPATPGQQPSVRLAYHWLRDGETKVFEGYRTDLTHAVRPGGDTTLTCSVLAPEGNGEDAVWSLELDMVAEGDRWFGTSTSVPVEIVTGTRTRLLDARRDGLVPLDAALSTRAELRLPGQLLRMMGAVQSTDTLPTDFEEAIVGLPVGEWALDRTALSQLVEVYRRRRPPHVAEFGSGTSTVLLAALARESGVEWPAIVSFEQDPAEVAKVRATLRARGLDQFVDVVHAPLTPVVVGGMKFLCYSPGVIAEALDRRPPTLVIIDGPSQVSGGSRYPTLLLSQRHIAAPATFLLDDAWRDEELTIGEYWSRLPGITVDGIVPTEHGMLIGTVSAV